MTRSEEMVLVREEITAMSESVAGRKCPQYPPPSVSVDWPHAIPPSPLCITIGLFGGSASYRPDEVHRMHVLAVGIACGHGFAGSSVLVVS